MLRSVSSWSAGVNETEHSIQTGYIEAINNAEHFIYIEVRDTLKHIHVTYIIVICSGTLQLTINLYY